ncbi:hypothetical protein [Microbacterium sp. PA5]|uniref:hypothetical protein n=1 Tax=Microbacterium sp. PA5 TaxID=3416654 RepID=UPI003CEE946E
MIEFSIESTAGTIPLATRGGNTTPYVFEPGVTGLGLPPDLFEWQESPVAGGRVRSHRVGMRDAEWPIVILGASQDEINTLANELARIIDYEADPQLVARYTTGEVWRLGFYRVGGADNPVAGWGDSHLRWVLSVRCPDPYWVSDVPVTIGPIGAEPVPVGLLPDLAELHVGKSSTFGAVTVENPGDAPSPVSWRISGPGGPTSVLLGGVGFTFETPLIAGEIVTIERGPLGWTILDQLGANRYADLGPAPKFPFVPKGSTEAVIQMDDLASGAAVTGFFKVKRKLVM